MKPALLAPRGTVAKKPPHGAPCTRCGLCCQAALCPLAARVFRGTTLPPGRHIPGPCPALAFDDDGLSRCDLADSPMKYAMGVTLRAGVDAARASAKHLIGSATGCDARINGEPVNDEFNARLREHDRRTAAQTRSAFKIWGMR